MAKFRVYEIAKKYNKDNKEILEILKANHVEVKNHMSTIGDEQIKMIENALKPKKEAKQDHNSKKQENSKRKDNKKAQNMEKKNNKKTQEVKNNKNNSRNKNNDGDKKILRKDNPQNSQKFGKNNKKNKKFNNKNQNQSLVIFKVSGRKIKRKARNLSGVYFFHYFGIFRGFALLDGAEQRHCQGDEQNRNDQNQNSVSYVLVHLFLQKDLFVINRRLEHSYEGKIAVDLVVVETVSHDKLVGNLGARIGGVNVDLTAGGLVEKGGDSDTSRASCRKQLENVGKGHAGIENILDDYEVSALNVAVEILDYLNHARGFNSRAVA